MVILDKPYVSDFFVQTLLRTGLPVLKNDAAKGFGLDDKKINFLEEKDFVAAAEKKENLMIYSNSENSANWIAENLRFTNLPENISLCKDKVKFRDLLKKMYPGFFYREIDFSDLENTDISGFPKPFIIKPSVGFFSVGVHKVNNFSDWENAVRKIKEEVENMRGDYPPEVINMSRFIAEENIDGEEFAVDVYYDKKGKPVILNVLKHIFSSGDDVSDRVYLTSAEIIRKNIGPFQAFLSDMGRLAKLKNFPVHAEFRVTNDGIVFPIEVNPMRFAGWCTTDIAYYAYGINVYEYYFNQKEPDWKQIFRERNGKVYSIAVADIPRGVSLEEIESIDYRSLASCFGRVLEMREIDYLKHGVMAFMFVETEEKNREELEDFLKVDFRDFIKIKTKNI